jgi:hypothetical protein
MWKKSQSILAVILLVIVIGTSVSGCNVSPARSSGDPRVDPFDTSRIATVRIAMKETD